MSSRRNFFKKVQRQKWQEGSYRNPYFEGQTTSWKPQAKRVGWVVGVLVLVGGFLYSPLLRINMYTIEGMEAIDPQEVEQVARSVTGKRSLLLFPRDHLLFFSEEHVSGALFEAFRLDQLDVKRTGRQLSIRLTEKISRIIWETQDRQYLVDETGIVLSEIDTIEAPPETDPLQPETPATTTPSLSVVQSLQQEPVTLGQRVLDETMMGHLLELLLLLRNSPLDVTSLEVDSLEVHFLRVHITDGYSVFFDPSISMQAQFERLVTVLKGESVDPSTYEYIDVRFGERVYIKDR